mmetsp:Transcript_58343/g.66562  ORF Transcript_58343/g.66562 Transcript_58343/m.66562 type:complete len:151 (+) Transcript_58343:311-763(+)
MRFLVRIQVIQEPTQQFGDHRKSLPQMLLRKSTFSSPTQLISAKTTALNAHIDRDRTLIWIRFGEISLHKTLGARTLGDLSKIEGSKGKHFNTQTNFHTYPDPYVLGLKMRRDVKFRKQPNIYSIYLTTLILLFSTTWWMGMMILKLSIT